MEGLSPIWPNSRSALFFSCLVICQPPLRYLTNTVKDVYFFVRGRIIFGDMFLSPILHNFHLCGKKHTHAVSNVYFLVRGWIIFWDVLLFIPSIVIFSIVRKKNSERQTDKQTNKQHLTLDCPAKTEIIVKKKEIQSGGTQLKVKWSDHFQVLLFFM